MHHHLDRVEVGDRGLPTPHSSLYPVYDHVITCITTSIWSRWALGVFPRLTHPSTARNIQEFHDEVRRSPSTSLPSPAHRVASKAPPPSPRLRELSTSPIPKSGRSWHLWQSE